MLPALDMQHEGCGLIALNDVTMYLQEGDKTISFTDYRMILYGSYAALYFTDYAVSKIGLPLTPPTILNSLNTYNGDYSKEYVISPIDGDKDILLGRIKASIISGKPVIALITNLSTVPSDDESYYDNWVEVYSLEEFYLEDSNTCFSESYDYVGLFNYHYVTITGVLTDSNTGKTYLRIQTWGMERYIEYDDFYEKCQNYLGVDFNEGVGEMKVSCLIYGV